MSAFTGRYEPQAGYAKLPRNKGVLAAHRAAKRKDAVDRNAETPPEKRSTKRARRPGAA